MSALTSFLTGLLLYVGPVVVIVLLWKWLKLKPAVGALYAASVWLCLGLVASVVPGLEGLWWGGLVVWSVLGILDAVLLSMVPAPEFRRKLPGRFAIDVAADVELELVSRARWATRYAVYDGLPMVAECEALPWSGKVRAGGKVHIFYPLKIRERGRCRLEEGYVEITSPFCLWSKQVRVGESDETRVYPNYEPVIQFALLAMESSPEQMGIVMKNRVGLSKDFHQLRDYQLGDTLSKVDWKATSKKLQLISRDYQEQRDQNVILAVDCGQRMRAMDGDIPQFDHCLNAMLLLAYVALKQGDNVGVMSFGGEQRWLPPVKGVNSMTTILNHLYDYRTTAAPSDYAEAAEKLLMNQSRRSLVVFLSNIRGEDGSDIIDPLRLVRKRHVTVLANLREKEVVDSFEKPVGSLEEALALGATQQYLDERQAILKELAAHGIYSVDETAQDLPVALANAYLVARERV
ncbi:DUF58 domain-containing protein [Rubritalea tangerina]|uniref:DUF58 domain-containing protein n=1 Tax=Rubritalea tangerina TaxID=430798 RepID=A0ABW4Z6W0_9BACT